MESLQNWIASIEGDVIHLFEQVVNYVPQLVGGLVLMGVGLLVARLLRALTVRGAGAWDRMLQKFMVGRIVTNAETRQSSISVVSTVVYWLTLLFFATAAAHTLNLELFSTWLERAILYIPTIISGAVVVVFGLVLGSYARDAIRRSLTIATRAQRERLAGVARSIIILTGFLVGLELIGIDTTVLLIVLAIGLSLVAGGTALAFGLGSQSLVSNLIGARQARRQCQIGDMIRIGTAEGRILSLGQSAVVLEGQEGRMVLPGKMFTEEKCLLLQGEVRDD